jgi:hypothetical protein
MRVTAAATATCILFGAFSVYALVAELSSYRRPFPNTPEFLDVLASAPPTVGLSYDSQASALSDCDAALMSVGTDVRATIRAKLIGASCEAMSARLTIPTPVNSYAWLVRAMASASLQKDDEAERSLRMSQGTGPYELWIAAKRVDLVERFGLQEKLADLYSSDLAAMLNSRSIIKEIARRYRDDAAFRKVIEPIVEAQSETIKVAFLQAVRQSMQNP